MTHDAATIAHAKKWAAEQHRRAVAARRAELLMATCGDLRPRPRIELARLYRDYGSWTGVAEATGLPHQTVRRLGTTRQATCARHVHDAIREAYEALPAVTRRVDAAEVSFLLDQRMAPWEIAKAFGVTDSALVKAAEREGRQDLLDRLYRLGVRKNREQAVAS